MKQIEVSIMGNSYRLGCPEGGEKLLQEAVARLDKEMCGIRDAGKIKARERIAVLAALNLAYLLAQRPAAAAPKPAEPADAAATAAFDPAQIDSLIGKLDHALEHDGHLL